MSWLSNIGKAVGKGVKDVGHTVGKVASNPIVDAGLAMIPGVGPGVAAAAGGLGRLMAPGGNIGNALGGAAKGYAAGMAGNAVRGAMGAGGGIMGKLGALGSSAKGALAGSVPNAMQPQGGGQAGGGIMQQLGGLVRKPDGSLDLGKILGAAGTVSGIVGQQQANKQASNYYNTRMNVANNAMTAAQQDYGSRAGLRNNAFASLGQFAQNGGAGSMPFKNYAQQQQPPKQSAAGGSVQQGSLGMGGNY